MTEHTRCERRQQAPREEGCAGGGEARSDAQRGGASAAETLGQGGPQAGGQGSPHAGSGACPHCLSPLKAGGSKLQVSVFSFSTQN